MILPEEWRPVVGYVGSYEVSSLGNVRSVDRIDSRGWRRKGRPIRPATRPSGYLVVSLCSQGVGVTKSVHTLVAEAFLGPRPAGLEVAHFDGRPTNNTLPNLRYATRSENQLDAVRHGTHAGTRRQSCTKGHPLDGVKYRDGGRRRYCKTCSNALRREQRRRAVEVAS